MWYPCRRKLLLASGQNLRGSWDISERLIFLAEGRAGESRVSEDIFSSSDESET